MPRSGTLPSYAVSRSQASDSLAVIWMTGVFSCFDNQNTNGRKSPRRLFKIGLLQTLWALPTSDLSCILRRRTGDIMQPKKVWSLTVSPVTHRMPRSTSRCLGRRRNALIGV